MALLRPNKSLENQIREAVTKLRCPIHNKEAQVTMPSENEAVNVKACCVFFRNDVTVVAERIRKDFLYRAEKTRERLEKERRRGKP